MDKALLHRLLSERFDNDELSYDEPMAAHTTFGVGGPVDFFVSPSDVAGVRDAIEAARAANAEWRCIGCGSNILVADEGLEGLVIHIGPNMSAIEQEGHCLVAEAGATNEELANAALAAGLTGYEFASGIPGSVGGAAIMNAGAYEGEFKDVCVGVSCLDATGKVIELSAQECEWGYRHSRMMDEGLVVLSAKICLIPWQKDQINAKMDDLKRRREEKQPLEYGSAGSTFKRPLGYYAGKLIEDAGMRGHRVGDAQVSEKHCGFVINRGHAKASDVLGVIHDVQKAVFSDAGVHLEPEVRMWGFDDD